MMSASFKPTGEAYPGTAPEAAISSGVAGFTSPTCDSEFGFAQLHISAHNDKNKFLISRTGKEQRLGGLFFRNAKKIGKFFDGVAFGCFNFFRASASSLEKMVLAKQLVRRGLHIHKPGNA